MPNRVVVVGSINVDSILHIHQLPQPGETIQLNDFSKAAGGKGANQAVAAVRSGATTSFVGKVGNDDNGEFMLNELGKNSINIENITKAYTQTGQAYILLVDSGQNSIIVQHGANAELSVADIEQAKSVIAQADFTVAQAETPLAVATAAFKIAHQAGKTTILNPAPAQKQLPAELLAETDLIIPNETESSLITGIAVTNDISSYQANADYYHKLGIAGVIITLGSSGSYVSTKTVQQQVAAFKVKAVDTTAAGDTFIGALSAVLEPDLSNLLEAVTYASKASSLTVQSLGAFPSIPMYQQVTQSLVD
ncbi:ribokinase [Lactiplantibacillus fabifermentans T30PCM01]|uniref:Ribokinase n=1 Tax=Lactiplantibacillus fabifermentans T30PCM01 TaxID=1400520 RepID=W6T4N0_9LACO|nr:ribokinase [Lactiplantibacillus fabifermentans]ETY72698.1 ribokinase [Lactiplantibacillus fabifermentans T30PCM01]